MRNNPRLRSKLLIGFVLALFLAHGATPLANPRVRELGNLFMCQCGCFASVTECNMINCHFSDPAREKLLGMVEAGKSDKEVIDAMVAEYGLQILRKPPAEGFFLSAYIMPFAVAGAGLGIIYLVLRRYVRRRPAAAPAGAPDSPELARYRDQIEKEMSDLD
jgi:cytochrome c-type biogenesis protein CcmH